MRSTEAVEKPLRAEQALRVVEAGGYPELLVDGSSFFLHGAVFPYYRIPRDMWDSALERYRALGINTIFLSIPWNWHEPAEGQFDFEGRTNPRRDLGGLLRLIQADGLKLAANLGPENDPDWRYDGYPGWLLGKSQFHLDRGNLFKDSAPHLERLLDARLQRTDPEAELYRKALSAWFAAAGKEVAPLEFLDLADKPQPLNQSTSKRTGNRGTLLFVYASPPASGLENSGAAPWFMALAEMIRAAGIEAPLYATAADSATTGAAAESVPPPVLGSWTLRAPASSAASSASAQLDARAASEAEFDAERLAMQPDFVPLIGVFRAGTPAPADDDHSPPVSARDVLLASRLLLANGVRGLAYATIEDALTPAGYSVPWVNRFYGQDAAIGAGGQQQPQADAIQRNAALLDAFGPVLAASHRRVDFGIVDLSRDPAAQNWPAALEAQHAQSLKEIERLASLALLSGELVDPTRQTADRLAQDPILLLPEPPSGASLAISDSCQRSLADYVRKGGVLVEFPEKPSGKILDELWAAGANGSDGNSETSPGYKSAADATAGFGAGRVVWIRHDFGSWISLDEGLSQNRLRAEAPSAIRALRDLVTDTGLQPVIERTDASGPDAPDDLLVSALVSDSGDGRPATQGSRRGFLSVTNLGESAATIGLSILAPGASARDPKAERIPVRARIPARDSVLLPIGIPICGTERAKARCGDWVSSSGAELIGIHQNGKDVELSFYAPARAEVHLHLASAAAHVSMGDSTPGTTWDAKTKDLKIIVPRGPSPGFEQTITLRLPHLSRPPQEKTEKARKRLEPGDLEYMVENAVRLPVSENEFLRSYPPLLVPDADNKLTALIMAENHNTYSAAELDLIFGKPLRGDRDIFLSPRGSASAEITLPSSDQDRANLRPGADGLFHETITLRGAHQETDLPLDFLPHRKGGVDRYRYDFDRDGMDEWVLESDLLRLIISPESGGSVMALMDKSSGASLSSSVGLLRDGFSQPGSPTTDSPHPGEIDDFYNQAYAPEWLPDSDRAGIRLHYGPRQTPWGEVQINKTVRMDARGAIEADYRVGAGVREAASPAAQPQFVVRNSVRARAAPDGSQTRFCWNPGPKASLQCSDFLPGGPAIELPQNARSVEIRTPGQPSIELTWDCPLDPSAGKQATGGCARMRISPKNFSALLQLIFAPLSGGQAGRYSIRIRVLKGAED